MMRGKLIHGVEKTVDQNVYSYLNIRDRNLGKWYKETGQSPLPEDFVLSEKAIEEALLIGQMKDKRFTVPFGSESKASIRKKAKLSLNNCKKLLLFVEQNKPYSQEFNKKFASYLKMRMHLTSTLFEDAKKQEFDEIAAFREIHNLDPVFAEILEFGEKPNSGLYGAELQPVINENVEKKYKAIHSQKLKKIQQNNNKKGTSKVEKQPRVNLQKTKEAASKIQKDVQASKKRENKKSAEKVRQEIKTTNAENKAKKIKERK